MGKSRVFIRRINNLAPGTCRTGPQGRRTCSRAVSCCRESRKRRLTLRWAVAGQISHAGRNQSAAIRREFRCGVSICRGTCNISDYRKSDQKWESKLKKIGRKPKKTALVCSQHGISTALAHPDVAARLFCRRMDETDAQLASLDDRQKRASQ